MAIAEQSPSDLYPSQLKENTPVKPISAPEAPKDAPASTHTTAPKLVSYTRAEVLYLSRSPLVKPPDGMPALKEWFGDFHEQAASSKREEASGSNAANGNHGNGLGSAGNGLLSGGRDRIGSRYRRDNAEDGSSPRETSTRPSFTSKPSFQQGSQMGSFRHQSLRSDERGDGDKDRERGDRDKDKEHRGFRDRERDKDGHERLRSLSDRYDRDRLLSSANSATAAGQASPSATRRETAPHISRGGALAKTNGRDAATKDSKEKGEAGREAMTKERRETGRGEKSEDWRRVGEKEGRTRSPTRDATSRQDRSPTNTRWRENGAPTGRTRDKDRENNDYDREGWSIEDGRGGRRRRGEDDGARGREKEKEPAWMGDYDEPGEKVFGRAKDGEIDGIQAWKKEIREKERKERETLGDIDEQHIPPEENKENDGLDEIQRFRLKMNEEKAKKERDENVSEAPFLSPPPGLNGAGGDATASLNAALGATLSVLQQQSKTDSVPPEISIPSRTDPAIVSPLSTGILSAKPLTSPSSTSLNQSSAQFVTLPPSKSSSIQPSPIHPTSILPNQVTPIGHTRSQADLRSIGPNGRSGSTTPSFDPIASSRSRTPGGLGGLDTRPSQSPVHNTTSNPLSGFTSPIDTLHSFEGLPGRFSAESAQSPGASGASNSPLSAQPAYAQAKGSRFAKFWDGKTREAAAAGHAAAQAQAGIGSLSSRDTPAHQQQSQHQQQQQQQQVPPPQQQQQQQSQPSQQRGQNDANGHGGGLASLFGGMSLGGYGGGEAGGNSNDGQRMQEILAMLQNSQQRRATPTNQGPPSNHLLATQNQPVSLPPAHSHITHQNQHLQSQHVNNSYGQNGHLDYDNRFVPDGMVPGLRPQTRSRDVGGVNLGGGGGGGLNLGLGINGGLSAGGVGNSGLLFPDDERMQFDPRRAGPQQLLDSIPSRPIPQLYGNQASGGGRNVANGQFPPTYRTGHSPNPTQQMSMRLGPQIRSPHELQNPQFLSGMNGGGMHQIQGPPQFNFPPGGLGGLGGVGGGMQQRGPAPSQLPGLQHMGHGGLGGVGGVPQSSLEFAMHQLQSQRIQQQQQQLPNNPLQGLGANGVRVGGGSGVGVGFGLQGHPNQMMQQAQMQQQQPPHGLRQPHMGPGGLPPHVFQQNLGHQQPNPNDLMALLMGGQAGLHRNE
ncbi:hypothetical protein BOTBODRAFT_64580 [Botryobasidium botryosum FD-172 SS1]|uniref:Uncharacterized protein n=1 Tax=Botryobasidium botryosum (strain FD-172 SS1) TaxID=930990 RepID=A0A067MPG7_BOTB1|nr:hypothetical protein BOTBODRAFT_64580 [Botryobasidium botryosum FD-172 SS1]